MPAGLECYADNGTPTLSVTDRITKILGMFETNSVDGSINVPEFGLGKAWARGITYSTGTTNDTGAVVSIVGTNLSWSYPPGPPNNTKRNTKIIYGIY